MLTVNKLVAGGRGLAAALLKRAATVELDWDIRQKSRFDAQDSAGRTIGVFLARGTSADRRNFTLLIEAVRDAINAANVGVSASIVNDGSGYRLVVARWDDERAPDRCGSR